MGAAYVAPQWTNGSGEGISASNLQAISNCLEDIIQGSNKAIHSISFSNGYVTITYVDGTVESNVPANMKGISSIAKTGTSGKVDTYTVTYTDGTTFTYTVTNGADGTYPTITATATADAVSSDNPTVNVEKTGTDDAPNFKFEFHGLKGQQGEQGEQGIQGPDGKSAYEYAEDGGYSGTEAQFYSDLGDLGENIATVQELLEDVAMTQFSVDFATGNLIYTENDHFLFEINYNNGNLEWEVSV